MQPDRVKWFVSSLLQHYSVPNLEVRAEVNPARDRLGSYDIQTILARTTAGAAAIDGKAACSICASEPCNQTSVRPAGEALLVVGGAPSFSTVEVEKYRQTRTGQVHSPSQLKSSRTSDSFSSLSPKRPI